MSWLFRLFDLVRGPGAFQAIWRMLTRVRPLLATEIDAGAAVLGPGAIRYGDVRIAEGGVLNLVFRLNRSRAVATFHTINLPSSGRHSSSNLDIFVHELTHVRQFEQVGSLYIGQALSAQWTDGYKYGGPDGLIKARQKGKRFRDYNREQQGQIAQDYYRNVTARQLPPTDATRQAYEPFIDDLRSGDL